MRHHGRIPEQNNGRKPAFKLQPLAPEQVNGHAPTDHPLPEAKQWIPKIHKSDEPMFMEMMSLTGQTNMGEMQVRALYVLKSLYDLKLRDAKIVVYVDDKAAGTINLAEIFPHGA